MTGFQRLCLVTCAVIFGLIILGGVVRATDSGLGCPDWPRCHGSFIPRWEKHTLIEYSHRLTASIAGVLVLAILIWTLRSYRRVPALVYPAVLAFGLLLVQAGLGGAAVLNELPPEIIAVHLGTAIAILSLLLLITMTAFSLGHEHPATPATASVGRLGALAAAGAFPLLIAGSYVSGAGYGLACNGWPLCNGELIPSANAASVQAVFLHRLLALLVGLTLAALAFTVWRSRAETGVKHLAFAALAVFIAQSLVGAANVWTELADEVTGAHLALATLLWVDLALLNIRVHRLHRLLPHMAHEKQVTDLARAAR
jgi:heme a synthase